MIKMWEWYILYQNLEILKGNEKRYGYASMWGGEILEEKGNKIALRDWGPLGIYWRGKGHTDAFAENC